MENTTAEREETLHSVSASSFAFHKIEYVALRSEILSQVKQLDLILYVGFAGSATSASWLLTSELKLPPAFWCVPLGVSVLSFIMYYQKAMIVGKIGNYIRKIESLYADQRIEGWEKSSFGRIERWWMPMNVAITFYWIAFLGVNVMFCLPHIGVAIPAVLSDVISLG